jgi:mannose-6-phosphate isomerase-like protein (cupin superfamily)
VKFVETSEKGIARFLVEEGIESSKLRAHVTRLEGGKMPHPAHTHGGVEGFYMMKGSALVESEGERVALGEREMVVLDATKPHGISNPGVEPIEYLVVTSE